MADVKRGSDPQEPWVRLLRHLTRFRVLVMLTGLVGGLLPVLLYAFQFRARVAVGVLGFAIGSALASGLIGALAGFLFGVPRFARQGPPRGGLSAQSVPEPAGEAAAGSAVELEPSAAETACAGRWYPNSNLEQVSDWLTKILIGVALTQFRGIGRSLGDLFHALGPGLGGASSSAAFAGLVLAYFATLGFIAGYVFTVGFLPVFVARRYLRLACVLKETERAASRPTGVEQAS
jgi:hypothetical protein